MNQFMNTTGPWNTTPWGNTPVNTGWNTGLFSTPVNTFGAWPTSFGTGLGQRFGGGQFGVTPFGLNTPGVVHGFSPFFNTAPTPINFAPIGGTFGFNGGFAPSYGFIPTGFINTTPWNQFTPTNGLQTGFSSTPWTGFSPINTISSGFNSALWNQLSPFNTNTFGNVTGFQPCAGCDTPCLSTPQTHGFSTFSTPTTPWNALFNTNGVTPVGATTGFSTGYSNGFNWNNAPVNAGLTPFNFNSVSPTSTPSFGYINTNPGATGYSTAGVFTSTPTGAFGWNTPTANLSWNAVPSVFASSPYANPISTPWSYGVNTTSFGTTPFGGIHQGGPINTFSNAAYATTPASPMHFTATPVGGNIPTPQVGQTPASGANCAGYSVSRDAA